MTKWRWVFLGMSVACFAAALATRIATWQWEEGLYATLYDVLVAIGIVFAAAVIVEYTLLSEAVAAMRREADKTRESTINEVKRVTSALASGTIDSITHDFERQFDIVRDANSQGVLAILPPRRDPEYGKDTERKIRDAVEKTAQLRVMGVSLLDFLDPGSSCYAVLAGRAKDSVRQPQYDVKILQANRDGDAAEIRGLREDPKNPDAIRADIDRAAEGINRLANTLANPNFQLEVKYYEFIPQAWFVITDEMMFIEQYHMGDIRNLFPDNDPCVGGRVHIIVLDSKSRLYKAMLDYFDWLWALPQSSSQILRSNFNVLNGRMVP